MRGEPPVLLLTMYQSWSRHYAMFWSTSIPLDLTRLILFTLGLTQNLTTFSQRYKRSPALLLVLDCFQLESYFMSAQPTDICYLLILMQKTRGKFGASKNKFNLYKSQWIPLQILVRIWSGFSPFGQDFLYK